MMVPRSYMRPTLNEKSPVQITTRRRRARSPASLSSSPNSTKSKSPSRCSGTTIPTSNVVTRPSPTPISPHGSKDTVKRPVIADRLVSEPKQITTSLPMSIPTKKSTTLDSVPKTRTRSRRPAGHDSAAIPPAVASLLSMTSIPPPKGRPGRLRTTTSSLPRRVSIERLRSEWRKDSGVSSMGTGSPLDFLLESADDEDSILMEDDYESKSITTASRSVSSESMTSTPSLEGDVGTYSSSYGSFTTPTPSLRRSSRCERKVCSPPAEECHEHPLLAISIPEKSTLDITPLVEPQPSAPISKSRFKLKSNLTASFQALKSAAKSFSNFTAPSLPMEDFLTRSLFASSEKYAPEMRPRTFDSVPDPALRRYLNPTPALSSPDFHSMLTDALGARDPDPLLAKSGETAPMIPMQTYSRNGRSRSRKQPPTERTDAASRNAEPAQRQREPRENSDFLRVIVLEMNMRRCGKLDAKSGGRARVWLPPRKASDAIIQVTGVQSVVPSRWTSTTIDELT